MLLAVIQCEQHPSFCLVLAGDRFEKVFGSDKTAQERSWSIQAGQRIERTRLGVENVVNAVPRQCSFKFASVAEVDRDGGHRPLGFPVQHKTMAQNCGDFFVRIKHGAEEAAVGAAKLVSQFA